MTSFKVFTFGGIQYRARFEGNRLRVVCRRMGNYHAWRMLGRKIGQGVWDAFSSSQVFQ